MQSEKPENTKSYQGAASAPPNNLSDHHAWISGIHESEIDFVLAPSSQASGSTTESLPNGHSHSVSTLDEGDKIIVRVNSANWSSTSLSKSESTSAGNVYNGKIFGLAGSSSYLVEILTSSGDQTLCQSSLVTRPVQGSLSSGVLPSQPQPTLRPDSPTTTLKNSIKAAEAQLTEVRARSKKFRKDHRNVIGNLERDVSISESRVSGAGNDARQRQRAIQHEQSIAKAERDMKTYADEIEELGPVPTEDIHAHDEAKKQFEDAKSHNAKAKAELGDFKTECDRQVGVQVAENSKQVQKRERLQKKLQEFGSQMEALAAENAKSQQELDMRNWQRNTKVNERNRMEQQYLGQINQLEQQRQMYEALSGQVERKIGELDNSPAPAYASHYSSVLDGHFSASGFGQRSANLGLGGYGLNGPSGMLDSRRGSLYRKNRERKSSMLSDASGFTDDALSGSTANGFGPIGYPAEDPNRQNSDGSVVHYSPHVNDQSRGGTPDKLGPVGSKP